MNHVQALKWEEKKTKAHAINFDTNDNNSKLNDLKPTHKNMHNE